MTSHRQLERASRLLDCNEKATQLRDCPSCPIGLIDYRDPDAYVWRHTDFASLALDGMPAKWPRPRRTPVAR